MKDQRMWPLAKAWFQARAVGPRDVPDGVAQVMARVPEVRQRGRWWPLPVFERKARTAAVNDTTTYQSSPIPATKGHAPTVIGRTQTMFSPVKAITAGALVFVLGGLFLVAHPFDQEESAPGATTDTGIGEVTPFEGVMHFGANPVPGVIEALPNGVIQKRGVVWTLTILEMSDPRLDGTGSSIWNRDEYLSGDQHRVTVGGLRIENEDGAWQMRPIVRFALPDGEWPVYVGTFDGEGGYEGLTATAAVAQDGSRLILRGVVIEGEVPPVPESMRTE